MLFSFLFLLHATFFSQAAEMQVLLENLQEELQEQKQKNSNLENLCEQKESNFTERVRKMFLKHLLVQILYKQVSNSCLEIL